MAHDGYTSTRLSQFDERKLNELVERYVQRELTVRPPNTYKWSYKSGSIVVSGKLGNFDFEQELSMTWFMKAAVVGTAAVKLEKIDWNRVEFRKDNHCIGYLCVADDQSRSSDAQQMSTTP